MLDFEAEAMYFLFQAWLQDRIISIHFKVATTLLKVRLVGKGFASLSALLPDPTTVKTFLTHTNIGTKSRTY